MGAKDSLLVISDEDPRALLRAAPSLDHGAARQLVERLHPGAAVLPVEDTDLMAGADPDDGRVHAVSVPGLDLLCSAEVALDRPSLLDPRFLAAAGGRRVVLHAMHSVVDWCAYAVWDEQGTLVRSFSASPDSGVMEDLGEPLPFEMPYRAGEHPVGDGYPLPFHPLELAEDALHALLGFTLEGMSHEGDLDPEDLALAAFDVRPPTVPAPPATVGGAGERSWRRWLRRGSGAG